MASEKTVNYTAEQTAELLAGYAEGKTVETLATETGRSVRSVVAKLSREGVYKSKEAAKEARKATKADLVAKLAATLKVEVKVLESLEKATREALEVLASKVTVTAEPAAE